MRIEGHPGPLTADDVTGVVVHTDCGAPGGSRAATTASEPAARVADWSFRDNACDIPTDCPQRERAGWTGDWQLFSPTAAFLYDVAGFSTKWLRDLAADQRKDGAVRNFAPDPTPPRRDPARSRVPGGVVGMGRRFGARPVGAWRAYADRRLLEEQWPSMVGVGRLRRSSGRADQRHGWRIAQERDARAARAVPVGHGVALGGVVRTRSLEDDHFQNFANRDFAIVATAFFAYTTRTLAAIARIIGRDDDAVATRSSRPTWSN